MFDIGRVCVKIVGRDANKIGVVIDAPVKNYVIIDGQVRRRKCNLSHLEPLPQVLPLTKNASHEAVVAALKTINVTCPEKNLREPSGVVAAEKLVTSASTSVPLDNEKKPKAKKANVKTA